MKLQSNALVHYTYRPEPPRHPKMTENADAGALGPLQDASFNVGSSFFDISQLMERGDSLASRDSGHQDRDGRHREENRLPSAAAHRMDERNRSLLDGLGNTQAPALFVSESHRTPLQHVTDSHQQSSALLPSSNVALQMTRPVVAEGRMWAVLQHQRVTDRLEMPSQQIKSPSLFGNRGNDGNTTEDSLLLALESSIAIRDDKSLSAGQSLESVNDKDSLRIEDSFLTDPPAQRQNPKFSFDFLNTPSPLTTSDASRDANPLVRSVSTRGQNATASITGTVACVSPADSVERGRHDVILFPASFDEFNNPFVFAHHGAEGKETGGFSAEDHGCTAARENQGDSTTNAMAVDPISVSSSTHASPVDTGSRKIVLASLRQGVSRQTPIRIAASPMTGCRLGVREGANGVGRANGGSTARLVATIETACLTPLRRSQSTHSITSSNTPSTPHGMTKPTSRFHVVDSPRMDGPLPMRLALPRKTPLAGIPSMERTSPPQIQSGKRTSALSTHVTSVESDGGESLSRDMQPEESVVVPIAAQCPDVSVSDEDAVKLGQRRRSLRNASPALLGEKRTRTRMGSQMFAGRRFVIVVGDGREDAALKTRYNRIIQSHGGTLLNNCPVNGKTLPSDTFLLSTGFQRTSKFMLAVVLGIPRVTFHWIDVCVAQQTFVHPATLAAFVIEPPAGAKPCPMLFANQRLLLDGTARFKGSWGPVLVALGGTLVTSVSVEDASDVTVLAEHVDRPSEKSGAQTVTVDWLIGCIMKQSFL